MAAFRAPLTETHATGTPGGICTIERRASSPPMTLLEDVRGTPITGRSRVRGDDARERRGHSCAGDKHSRSTQRCGRGVLGHATGVSMGRQDLELPGDPALVQLDAGRLHGLTVGLRADEDPDERTDVLELLDHGERERLSSGIGVDGCERDVVTVLHPGKSIRSAAAIGTLARSGDATRRAR